jgi:threonine synthase
MHYFSTNRLSSSVSFRDAVLGGQPADGGLYFPEMIPAISEDLASGLKDITNAKIAFRVIQPFAGGSIPDDALQQICGETVDFDFPLVKVSDQIYSLELFHGPTLAFKDVGARFMSRCLQYFSQTSDRKTIVVVATSGDTGGAVAAGFHGIDGVEVVILYPKGKVSKVQELQLTTLDGNVTALEVRGDFDDCQAMAKRALADADLNKKARIISANSINIARWLPQQFYYFFALKQWDDTPPIVSVPSGNFGNLAAGILARLSGLPIKLFIAACNANDVVPRFLETGVYDPKPSIATLSNAMDVGDPSNFVRVLESFDQNVESLNKKVIASSISDAATSGTITEVYEKYGYLLDPHGAIAYRALEDQLKSDPKQKGIILETAHPIKFDSVTEILGRSPEVPLSIEDLFSRKKVSLEIDNDYTDVKEILISKI